MLPSVPNKIQQYAVLNTNSLKVVHSTLLLVELSSHQSLDETEWHLNTNLTDQKLTAVYLFGYTPSRDSVCHDVSTHYCIKKQINTNPKAPATLPMPRIIIAML